MEQNVYMTISLYIPMTKHKQAHTLFICRKYACLSITFFIEPQYTKRGYPQVTLLKNICNIASGLILAPYVSVSNLHCHEELGQDKENRLHKPG